MTAHFHIVPRLRTTAAVSSLPHSPSLCDSSLITRRQITFSFAWYYSVLRMVLSVLFHTNMKTLYIHSNEIHNVVALIKCLLILRCQLYIFRTVTVHPQELLSRCCMCRLWYVARNALPDTSSWYNVWGRTQTLYQRDVSDSAVLTTYHSLHIQHLQRSSWGWTVTVRNM